MMDLFEEEIKKALEKSAPLVQKDIDLLSLRFKGLSLKARHARSAIKKLDVMCKQVPPQQAFGLNYRFDGNDMFIELKVKLENFKAVHESFLSDLNKDWRVRSVKVLSKVLRHAQINENLKQAEKEALPRMIMLHARQYLKITGLNMLQILRQELPPKWLSVNEKWINDLIDGVPNSKISSSKNKM